MLRSLKDLSRYTVTAKDGLIGKVVDFLLDDERWVVRYLVVDAGSLLNGRRVLVSPIAFRKVDWSTRLFHLSLTTEKVRSSPKIDTERPVSRLHERDFNHYFRYPYYWEYSGLWGQGPRPDLFFSGIQDDVLKNAKKIKGDIHLRSVRSLCDCRAQGRDADIGNVEDLIVDDEAWVIKYIVVDTSQWWYGKKVLVAPHWATKVIWDARMICVTMSRRDIEESPEWTSNAPVSGEYELRLYDYHGHSTRLRGSSFS
jgi:hypothetical protein